MHSAEDNSSQNHNFAIFLAASTLLGATACGLSGAASIPMRSASNMKFDTLGTQTKLMPPAILNSKTNIRFDPYIHGKPDNSCAFIETIVALPSTDVYIVHDPRQEGTYPNLGGTWYGYRISESPVNVQQSNCAADIDGLVWMVQYRVEPTTTAAEQTP